MDHLIAVAGHAIPRRFDRLYSDDGWFLKPFQRGEAALFVDHVRRGVELAAADPRALLVFAGGQSDAAAGPRSEAQGYWLIADHHDWWEHAQVRNRATVEEYSLDSQQNLLFAVCRFRELTGRYPDRLTAAGWRFKEARFDAHRAAIRWPLGRYRYEGVNDPPELDEARRFEQERLRLFEADPYGSGPEASAKRATRDPFRRTHGYHRSCPDLAALLDHAGPELFDGPLPWRPRVGSCNIDEAGSDAR